MMLNFIEKLLTYISPLQAVVIGLCLMLLINKIINSAINKYFGKNEKDSDDCTNAEKCDDDEEKTFNEDEENDLSALPENIKHIPFKPLKLNESEMLEKSNEFFKTMDARRTVRFFSTEPISEEILRNIIKTAGTSPSGAHTEPWTFVLVKDAAVKQEIREIVEDEEYVNYTRRMGKKWTEDLKPFKTNWSKPYLTDAPYLILVFKQLYSFTETGEKKNHYYNEISVAIASGLLIAAIHYAGLVTLTSTPLNCGPRLRTLLGRPASEKLMLLFPIGFPSDDCTVPDLNRKHLDEIAVVI